MGCEKILPADVRVRSAPTLTQEAWLRRGLSQAGGKLPLFDENGKRMPASTIRRCIDAGWAEPWFSNPLKPDWLVCKLTETGRAFFDREGKSQLSQKAASHEHDTALSL